MLKLVLPSIVECNRIPLNFNIIAISGTIQALQDKIIIFTWQRLHWQKSKATGVEKEKIKEIINSCRPRRIRDENKEFKTDFEYFNKMFSSIDLSFF